ncbi:hypothetical protein H072_3593 [Dactylellina haptotyla CBS 200.50]|uniref:Transmembrane protein n=1 Tax=Dactylellina haptotyla (strain CBS 200.50) TaxID=1284197 RepID=S8AMW9_DACHA|nr:hypothetical protein H072_3593 [Dactylellina haptotyla CBS 200.50]
MTKSKPYPLLGPILAILLSLSLTAIIAALPYVTWQLTEFGTYNSYQRTAYATVSTIISTLFTLFVTTQIRLLWLERVDILLTKDLNSATSLDSTWRTALGISSILEVVRNSDIQITYIFSGLITTAIVASFVPTTFQLSQFVYLDIPDGNPYSCANEYVTSPLYTWNSTSTPTGQFGCFVNGNGCPTRYSLTLIGGINTDTVTEYAYADAGVAIDRTAAGTTLGFYSSSQNRVGMAFQQLLNTYGASLLDVSACVPVLISTPYSCRVGGTLNRFLNEGRNMSEVISDNGLCRVVESYEDRSGEYQAASFCASGEVGQGTVVIGSTGGLTHFIGSALGLEVPHGANDTLVVTCDVNARQAFGYREVKLSFENSFLPGTEARRLYGRHLVGSSYACTPDHQTISDTLFAIAASANWQVLDQNRWNDGLLEALAEKTTVSATWRTDNASEVSRLPPWAFPNSKNALEDVFGLVSAMVVSRINSTTVRVGGPASVLGTRIGSGHPYGLAYCIPPLASAVTILVLLIGNRRNSTPLYHSHSIVDLLSGGSRY